MTANPGLGQQPSRMKPTDLAKTFASSPRSAGLRGLPPMEPVVDITPPPQPAKLPPSPEVEPVDSAALPKNAETRGTAKAKTPAGDSSHARSEIKPKPQISTPSSVPSSGTQTVVVYISVSIRERLRANTGDFTYTEVTLMALDATHGRLDDRFTAATRPANSLFTGRPRPASKRHEEPHVQVSLRPMRSDLAVVDRLVEEMNAPSRSALINAALDEYLP